MISATQVYQLASIVSHMGGSNAGKCGIIQLKFVKINVLSTGHYISDVYRPGSNLWKSYDDSTITEVHICFLIFKRLQFLLF